MTDKEKLEKLKKLADAMYCAAANLGPNVGSGERLRKTMEEYHQFIIYEYHKEEPVNEDLHQASIAYADSKSEYVTDKNGRLVELYNIRAKEHFVAGANWQKKQMIRKISQWLDENVSDWIDMSYDQKSFVQKFKNFIKED